MPGRAAGRDLDVGEATELRAVNGHRVQEYAARVERDAALRGVADGARLLVNLLEHEMLEPALFGLDRVPVDALNLRLDLRALPVGDADAATRQCYDFVVAQEEEVARVRQQRRNVRGYELFAVAQSDDDRRAEPRGHDLFRLVLRYRDQRVDPPQFGQRATEGRFKPAQWILTQMFLDQVSDDLGVGLGLKGMILALQLAFEFEVIFDDAIVDDDDPPQAIAVRVRVLFGRSSVLGPAAVPQGRLAFQRLVLYRLHQAVQLAGAPANLDLAVVDDGDARRVVAAIFQPPQPLDDDRDGLLIADVSDDSAHKISSENSHVVTNLFVTLLSRDE